MCVIITIEHPLDWSDINDYLGEAMTCNPDGAGLAWVDNDHIRWEKGIFTARHLRHVWDSAAGCFPRMFHARIATVGARNRALCHPFPMTRSTGLDVRGTAPRVMAHNGHWSDWLPIKIGLALANYPIPNGEWSDSRLLTYIATRFGKKTLGELPGQKIAILAPSGIHYIGNVSSWENSLYESLGIRMSNSTPLSRAEYMASFGKAEESISYYYPESYSIDAPDGYAYGDSCRTIHRGYDILTPKEREYLRRGGRITLGDVTQDDEATDD